MSTTFKKGWYLGKPLRELLPNTKYFKYWYLGKPFSLFDKPAVPSVPITIQLSECLHLTFTLNAPSIHWGWIVSVSTIQSLTLATYDPSGRAGIIDGANTFGSGIEVLYSPSPEVDLFGAGVAVIYSPVPTGAVSQVYVQVEYSETFVEVDQASVAVVYEGIPFVEVDQAGVVIVYTVDGIFVVNSQSLTLALYAPTVVAIFAQALDVLHLTLLLHAPTITARSSVTALPTIKSLTFDLFSPSVKRGCTVFTDLISLQLTAHSVSALMGALVSETLEAVLALYSPVIHYSSKLIVSKLSLVLALHSPTICHNGVALLLLQSLLLEVYTPAMRGGVNLNETLSLTLHQAAAPTVAWGYTVVIDAPKHLVLSLKSVTVRAIKNALGSAPLQTLTFALIEPEALLGVSVKETQHLIVSDQAPEIRTGRLNAVVSKALLLTRYAPSIHIKTVNPVDVQSLVINSYDVLVVVGYVIKITLVLQLSQFDVTVNYGATMIPDPLHLILTEYDPNIVALPFGPYDIDPLHKEREWGSSLTLGQNEYASRSGAALSSNFPLQSMDTDKQLTACCWLRLKGLGGRQTVFAKLLDSGNNISLGLFLLGSKFYLKWAISSSGIQTYPEIEFDNISLVANRWYHIGLVIDGVNRTIYLHVWDDKAKVVMTRFMSADPFAEPFPRYALAVGNGEFRIGYYYTSGEGSMWLNGYVDEFVVFNKLKSPFDIDQIRKGRFNGPSAGQTVGDFSVSVGYDPEGRITVADYALMVAYSVPIPPPPSRFPVISGFPSPGSGMATYVFCNLNYKFKSEVSSFDYGTNLEARNSLFSLPSRELETMIGISDESSYLRLMETLVAGATIYSVPIWALRTVLTSNAHAADLEFVAEDVSNLYVGEKVLLVRANDASIYDLCDITGIAGQTVSIETPLTLHYHKIQMPTEDYRYDTRGCYVVPCITGFVDAEDVELKGNKPTFWLKTKVNGGAWINAGHPTMIDFIQAPAEAGLISPKVERTIVGTENGMHELMPHLLTSRLAFQAEWYFKDATWKILRDMFISARGKATSIPMPTWCFELRVMSHRNLGSTTIVLTPGFEHIWSRFKRLLVYPITGAAPFTMTLTTYLGSNMYSCSELESELHPGDKVSLYPDVRFMEDELVFEFLYYNECKVKASFIEVVS